MHDSQLLSPLEETVIIVGVGLIGGSLALAIKERGIARTVIGVGRNQGRMESARDAGIIDEVTTDIATVIHRAELVVFCTPVDQVAQDVRRTDEVASHTLRRSTSTADLLLTDVGSVKAPICEQLADVPRFIGSHPIAGSHRQGFEAANAKLFEGRICVVTPTATAPQTQITRLERFWQAVGMRTVQMSPSAHDAALAITSHLPHLVAAALASILSVENRVLTGSGFRDTTRIAAGDAELWTGILMNNSASILKGIDVLQEKMTAFQTALIEQDSVTIQRLLTDGQRARNSLEQLAQGSDECVVNA